MLTILSAQLSGIKHIHIVVQPSPPSISRNFSSSQTETLFPLNTDVPSFPPAPGPHHLLPVSMDLTPLGTSREWNQTLCPFASGFFHSL